MHPCFRQPPAEPAPTAYSQRTHRRGAGTRLWLLVALAGFAVAVGAVGWWRFQHPNAPIPIAVLPLTNLSQDPANDYFADGLTDEIIRNLSIIEGLAVRSQTSSFAFKGKPRNLRDAESSWMPITFWKVRFCAPDSNCGSTPSWFACATTSRCGRANYDRELTDVLAIQDEISRGIVNSLRLKLGRGPPAL